MTKEYGMYLMDGESIRTGFKLVRDVLILQTNGLSSQINRVLLEAK
mgnify:CR=1 FL=1